MKHLLLVIALTACTTPETSSEPAELAPSPNDEAAFRFFVDRGLTEIQAAGIVGNLDAESSMNPLAIQPDGPGRGIAQWSIGGRWDTLVARAAGAGVSPWSLDFQLDHVWHELVHFPAFGLALLQQATTVEAATIAFQDRFEVCGDCRPETRIALAYAAYAAYAGKARRYAFQSDHHELWTQDGGTGLGMMPATSPAVRGGHVAFQSNAGSLWIDGANRYLGMAPGTSPSINANGTVAFQSDSGNLFVGDRNQFLGMAPRTSPSINASGVVAFQADTGALWIAGAPTVYGMAPWTSPSIADDGSVAFQANTGELWIDFAPTGLGMAPRTSPSLTNIPGGRRIAAHGLDGALWIDGRSTMLGMAPGTSPSAAPNGDVLFQANTGGLWRIDATGPHELPYGLAPGSSPAN